MKTETSDDAPACGGCAGDSPSLLLYEKQRSQLMDVNLEEMSTGASSPLENSLLYILIVPSWWEMESIEWMQVADSNRKADDFWLFHSEGALR
jgi:hypothetical protein